MQMYRIATILTMALVLLSVWPASIPAQIKPCDEPVPGEIFCDVFSDGRLDDGSPVTWTGDQFGTLSIIEESLRITKTSSNAVPLAVPNIGTLSNVSIEAQVRLLEGQSIGIAGRRTSGGPITNYFGYLYEGNDGTKWAGIGRGGTVEDLAGAVVDLDFQQSDAMIRLDIRGNALNFWAWPAGQTRPEEPLVSGVDNTLNVGSVFAWVASKDFSQSAPADGVFRYIRVTNEPLAPQPVARTFELLDNFDDGNDDGWVREDYTTGSEGPGVFDATNGAYELATTNVVTGQAGGLVTSMWDASLLPRFSNGFIRATVRADASRTNPFLLMRAPSGTGSPYYAFGADIRSGRFFIDNSTDVTYLENTGHYVFREGEEWVIEGGAVDRDGRTELSLKLWKVGEPEPAAPQTVIFDDTPLPPERLGVGAWVPFGGSRTNATFDDVFFSYAGPLCDFDGDGACTTADIDAMMSLGNISEGVAVDRFTSYFDLTGDSLVDDADITQWLADAAIENGYAAPYVIGDTNLDGTVDFADFVNLNNNWQQTQLSNGSPVAWSSGDFDGNGIVDFADFVVQNNNWQRSIASAAPITALPEPRHGTLFLSVVLGLVALRGKGMFFRPLHICQLDG
jgi:hypothetical protein